MSKRADRAFILACLATLAVLVAVATVAVATRPDPPRSHAAVSYPHGTRCDQSDAVTRQPCRAVRELLAGANNGQPALYCAHAVARPLYHACVNRIEFSGVKTFEDAQTMSFGVLYAQVRGPNVARVRVRVAPVDGSAVLDVYVWMVREYGWWRVYATSCASCSAPTPPS